MSQIVALCLKKKVVKAGCAGKPLIYQKQMTWVSQAVLKRVIDF